MVALTARRAGKLSAWLVTVIVAGYSSVAIGQIDPSVSEFFSRVAQAVSTLAGKTGKDADSACLALVQSLFDLDAFDHGTAGPVWDRMTAEQRTAYGAALEQRAVSNCVNDNQKNTGITASYLGVRATADGDRLLATRVGQPNSTAGRTVIWRLSAKGPPELRATDLLVDGRSTVLSLRDEVSALLQRNNGDIDAMIRGLGNSG